MWSLSWYEVVCGGSFGFGGGCFMWFWFCVVFFGVFVCVCFDFFFYCQFIFISLFLGTAKIEGKENPVLPGTNTKMSFLPPLLTRYRFICLIVVAIEACSRCNCENFVKIGFHINNIVLIKQHIQ